MFYSGGKAQRNHYVRDRSGATRHGDDFPERAYMMDIKVGQQKKDAAARVLQTGLDAMIKGKSDIVMASQGKLRSAIANISPTGMLAEEHRGVAQPKQ